MGGGLGLYDMPFGNYNTPFCDFNTWYQTYYPLCTQNYNVQKTPSIGSVSPTFQSNKTTSTAQPPAKTEKSGNGGKAVAAISAATLIAGGIACYRKGGGNGASEKIKNGFKIYKNAGLGKISKRTFASKGAVETLPEGATLRAGTFTHNNNTFTFTGNRITGYKNSNGEDLLSKFNNPVAETDKTYAETIKKALADINQGKTVDGFAVTPLRYELSSNGKKQLYTLITEECENKGKYDLREVGRKWFWQS